MPSEALVRTADAPTGWWSRLRAWTRGFLPAARPTDSIVTPPTDPASKRLNELVGFATELRLWDAYARFLHFILLGDPTRTDKPGLLIRCGRIFRERMGKLTVSGTPIPEPPPWPEKWPEPANPREATALVALRMHLGKLRDVYDLLKLEPASAVETSYGKLDLGGWLIPADYERRCETAAARLGVVPARLRASMDWLPELPVSDETLTDALCWPESHERQLAAAPDLPELPAASEAPPAEPQPAVSGEIAS